MLAESRERIEIALDVVVVPAAHRIDRNLDVFEMLPTLTSFQNLS